jgi:hypothetical protein
MIRSLTHECLTNYVVLKRVDSCINFNTSCPVAYAPKAFLNPNRLQIISNASTTMHIYRGCVGYNGHTIFLGM